MRNYLIKCSKFGLIGVCIASGMFFFWTRSPGHENTTTVTRQSWERGQLLFTRYQCLACHRLNGAGYAEGVDLSCTGEKMKSDWLRAFLKSPASYAMRRLDYAMPDYQLADDEVEDLVAFFTHQSQSSGGDHQEKCNDAHRVQEGKALFQAYGCQACHRVGQENFKVVGNFFDGAKHEAVSRQAPDLKHASRLKKSWAIDFMEKPGRFLPGTTMFNNGAGRSALEKIFDYLANPDLAAGEAP